MQFTGREKKNLEGGSKNNSCEHLIVQQTDERINESLNLFMKVGRVCVCVCMCVSVFVSVCV